ncbi:MAG: nuclear transport factor 2 family protein [Acidobacteria bacterium]|nr:nuclear transport factor 2 family protein [Acidobacteriota bacterium]MCA1607870.1 nuclear transport factor 2 family protein [Acidobacteriota bacterium]
MSEQNKKIVEEINAAFAEGNVEKFLEKCTENVEWTMVGEKHVIGKSAIREWMASMEGMEPPKFSVDRIIAEGDSVVCYGDMTMKDKDGKDAAYGFCDIYRFSGDKIAELTSYVVKTQTETQDERRAAA